MKSQKISAAAFSQEVLIGDSSFFTVEKLGAENRTFRGTGGLSRENRCHGFLPAFKDTDTGIVYLSRFASGRLAPVHLLEGLPQDVILRRTEDGRVKAVKNSMMAGFCLRGEFFTREQVAAVHAD